MHAEVLASSAHLICFWHNAGVSLEKYHKDFITPLVAQGRITFVVLASQVERVWRQEITEWAEAEKWQPWEDLEVELLHPVSYVFSLGSFGHHATIS
jgi:hypothetical protein